MRGRCATADAPSACSCWRAPAFQYTLPCCCALADTATTLPSTPVRPTRSRTMSRASHHIETGDVTRSLSPSGARCIPDEVLYPGSSSS